MDETGQNDFWASCVSRAVVGQRENTCLIYGVHSTPYTVLYLNSWTVQSEEAGFAHTFIQC